MKRACNAGELIFLVVVNMPRKTKPRKLVASSEEVWIAPRPANTSPHKAFEPAGAVPSNRYLEFADIALGVKGLSHKKKSIGPPLQDRHNQERKHEQKAGDPGNKVTPINRPRASNPNPGGLNQRRPKQNFGAFRNPR